MGNCSIYGYAGSTILHENTVDPIADNGCTRCGNNVFQLVEDEAVLKRVDERRCGVLRRERKWLGSHPVAVTPTRSRDALRVTQSIQRSWLRTVNSVLSVRMEPVTVVATISSPYSDHSSLSVLVKTSLSST